MYVHTYICVNIYVCNKVYIHIRMYVHTCICTYIHIYTDVHTHMQTYTHIHTYIHYNQNIHINLHTYIVSFFWRVTNFMSALVTDTVLFLYLDISLETFWTYLTGRTVVCYCVVHSVVIVCLPCCAVYCFLSTLCYKMLLHYYYYYERLCYKKSLYININLIDFCCILWNVFSSLEYNLGLCSVMSGIAID